MSQRNVFFCMLCALLLLQGCGVIIFNEEKRIQEQFLVDQEQFRPYKEQNTIEGYREFIARYPKNQFIRAARSAIENLEYAPYEQQDSIEGYMEFVMRYPGNPHVFKASTKIEQVEIKRYEMIDTIDGYREFLAKYPESIFAVLAKERLQDLEIRAFNHDLEKKYGFDVLLYFLTIKRLKKKLSDAGHSDLSGFSPFASVRDEGGNSYLHTSLIYAKPLSGRDVAARETQTAVFNLIVRHLVDYLDRKFTSRKGLYGFSFDISSSQHRFHGGRKVALEYRFSFEQLHRLAQKKISVPELVAQAVSLPQEKASIQAAQAPAAKDEPAGPQKTGRMPDAAEIMSLVDQRPWGTDYIMSSSWELTSGGSRTHTMKTLEKRKNFQGRDGCTDRKILRYLAPPAHDGTTILTVNYTKRKRAFWYRIERGDAARISNTERLRPPAESDFSLTDYMETRVSEEKHHTVRNEQVRGIPCYVVESTPISTELAYGKKISWIDPRRWVPLRIEFFNSDGTPSKTLSIKWQNKFGYWFWEEAQVDDLRTGDTTHITVEDVRVNVGLHDRDLSRFALERMSK